MDNQNYQKCGKLKYLKIKAQIEYDQRHQGGSSNPSQGRSPPNPPGVPHGARRVQYATEENINWDANHSNNDSVTSYSAYIASYAFLSSILSSLSAPHQHEMARSSKARLIYEVNTSYKYQFIRDSAATKHISGILTLFTAIKYFPKNYKGIVILGDSVTKLNVHGIGTIAVEIPKIFIELHDVLYVPYILDTLYSIIDHGRQPDCLFVIKNGATTVSFPTFTLQSKTNK